MVSGKSSRCIIWSLLVLISLPLRAQDSPKTLSNVASTSISQSTPTTTYTLPPDKLAKSRALYTLLLKLRIVDTIYSFLILLGLLFFRIAARYRDWAEAVSRRRFVTAWVFVPLLLITIRLLGFPLRVYGNHVSLQYGLSIQGCGSWLVHVLKGERITL